jgi:hypothetical protein
VKLGRKSVILTGSVVTKDVAPCSCVAGNTARDIADKFLPYRELTIDEKYVMMKKFMEESVSSKKSFVKIKNGWRVGEGKDMYEIVFLEKVDDKSIRKDAPKIIFTKKNPATKNYRNTTIFDLSTKTYTKRRTVAEIAVIKSLLYSKASADLLCQAYFETYGLLVIITRSSNNYGPYQYPEKLIPKTIIYALLNKPIPVYGTGENIRDWLYVEDNCEAIDLVLQNGKLGELYNIAANQELKNIRVVKTILKLTNKPESLIKFVKDRLGHDLRYSLNTEKIRELGWKPKTKFKDGIKKTLKWYKQNIEWWKPIIEKEQTNFHEEIPAM